jgi:hypothetical protein
MLSGNGRETKTATVVKQKGRPVTTEEKLGACGNCPFYGVNRPHVEIGGKLQITCKKAFSWTKLADARTYIKHFTQCDRYFS